MALSHRRSPTSATVHTSAIRQAQVALERLPNKPKNTWSIGEALDLILDTIRVTLAKGYSYVEVAEMLTSQGMQISSNALKYHLAKQSVAQSAAPTSKRRSSSSQRSSLAAADAKLAIAPAPERTSTLPKDKPPTFRKRGVEEVMAYLLDESDETTEPSSPPAVKHSTPTSSPVAPPPPTPAKPSTPAKKTPKSEGRSSTTGRNRSTATPPPRKPAAKTKPTSNRG